MRSVLLFPYVGPVVALAKTWELLLDPYSGTLNNLLINFQVIQEPLNLLGQKYLTINFFGFDLHPLTSFKKLNYNIYDEGTEYNWHIDAVPTDPVRDIKLTALLNLSEENYEGGELVLFRANEIICNEFNTPGSAIIFPSYINHKVNKIVSGKRHTLAIWMSGPKFR